MDASVRRNDSGIGGFTPPPRIGEPVEPRWRRGRADVNIGFVVEIANEDGAVPAALIEKGYRASQRCPVVFVLNGVSAQVVNLILDPVVPQLPLNIPGVIYVDIRDEERVRDVVLSARAILTSTDVFHRLAIDVAGDLPDATEDQTFQLLDQPQAGSDPNDPWGGLRQ